MFTDNRSDGRRTTGDYEGSLKLSTQVAWLQSVIGDGIISW